MDANGNRLHTPGRRPSRCQLTNRIGTFYIGKYFFYFFSTISLAILTTTTKALHPPLTVLSQCRRRHVRGARDSRGRRRRQRRQGHGQGLQMRRASSQVRFFFSFFLTLLLIYNELILLRTAKANPQPATLPLYYHKGKPLKN